MAAEAATGFAAVLALRQLMLVLSLELSTLTSPKSLVLVSW